MKGIVKQYKEVMRLLETQMKYLTGIQTAKLNRRQKLDNIENRNILQHAEFDGSGDDLKMFGMQKNWPFIFVGDIGAQQKSPTEEELKEEILKAIQPNTYFQYQEASVELDAIKRTLNQYESMFRVEEEHEDLKAKLTYEVPKKSLLTMLKNVKIETHQDLDFDVQQTDVNEKLESTHFDKLGNLNTMIILKKVCASLQLKAKIRSVFEMVFLSENIKNLVKNIFWWLYLDLLKPFELEAKDLLFNRMAENYVELLMAIPARFNDDILDVIPSVLSQTVYVIFHDGIHRFRQAYDDNFKQYISYYITKWTTGTVGQLKDGNKKCVKFTQPTEKHLTLAEILARSIGTNTPVEADAIIQEFEELLKISDTLSVSDVVSPTESLKLDAAKGLIKNKEYPETHIQQTPYEMESVKFNLYSQCPLVDRYKYNKNMDAIHMIPTKLITCRHQNVEKTKNKFKQVDTNINLIEGVS